MRAPECRGSLARGRSRAVLRLAADVQSVCNGISAIRRHGVASLIGRLIAAEECCPVLGEVERERLQRPRVHAAAGRASGHGPAAPGRWRCDWRRWRKAEGLSASVLVHASAAPPSGVRLEAGLEAGAQPGPAYAPAGKKRRRDRLISLAGSTGLGARALSDGSGSQPRPAGPARLGGTWRTAGCAHATASPRDPEPQGGVPGAACHGQRLRRGCVAGRPRRLGGRAWPSAQVASALRLRALAVAGRWRGTGGQWRDGWGWAAGENRRVMARRPPLLLRSAQQSSGSTPSRSLLERMRKTRARPIEPGAQLTPATEERKRTARARWIIPIMIAACPAARTIAHLNMH